MVWKSKGDGEKRKYDFSYDNANRLLKADFNQYTSGTFNKTANVDFSVKMGDGSSAVSAYDANGNIKAMTQSGLKLSSSSVIDNLTYNYQSNSNKLSEVTDANNDNTSTLGDFKYDPATKGTTDYSYDANGNLTLDNNKKISSITYNYLNLPSVISITGKGTITYTYDAAGNKLKKITLENASATNNNITTTTTTTYLEGFIYETKTDNNPQTTDYTDKLQFIPDEEGRIRSTGNTSQPWAFDYFIKDHLGNVRMVLTDEQKTDAYPAATMETAQAATEEQLYANLNNTRDDKPAGYPTDTYTNPNDKVARLKAVGGSQVGPSIVLKVMAGDQFNIRVSSWYNKNGATPGSPVSLLTDLLSNLINSVGAITATHGGATAAQLPSSGVLTPGATQFLNSQAYDAGKPKAYLNWILFDDQFKMVESSSGAEQAGADQEFKIHTKTGLPIDKNGYLYVYVSNETPNIDVFFDNLQVTHIHGPLLEETHYYPFGLTMAGISSKAFGGIENHKQFNGIEHTTDLDLNQYDAFYRTLDPQIGRFLQVDPKIESAEAWSPYSAMLDNPIRYIDPLGDSTIPGGGFWRNAWEGLKDGAKGTGNFVKSLGTKEGWQNLGNSISDAGDRLNMGSVSGLAKNAIAGQQAIEAVKNIPNMTKDDAGHALGYGTEKLVEAAVLSKGAGAVSKVAEGAGSTTLFRAASGAELTDAAANGVRNLPGAYEGKLFANSPADAAQYGKNNFGLDGVPNTIMKVKVPNSVMQGAYTGEMDGMKAVAIPESQLPKVQYLAPLNSSPRPTNPFGVLGW